MSAFTLNADIRRVVEKGPFMTSTNQGVRKTGGYAVNILQPIFELPLYGGNRTGPRRDPGNCGTNNSGN
jgi:hypothetical protein